MQCNGKCHLYKEVKKQQEEIPVSLQISLKEYPIGFIKIICLKKPKNFQASIKSYYLYLKNYKYLYTTSVLHPPIS
jgi:hypothetical protein